MNKNIKTAIKLISITIITILLLCLILKYFFPAEWSFITPHKQGDFVRVGNMHTEAILAKAILLNDSRVFIYQAGYVEIYNPKTRRFRKIKQNLNKDYYATATKLKDGKVIILGGRNNNNTTPDTYIFDPKTNKFEKGPDMLSGRYGHGAILLDDGRIFVAGGEFSDIQKSKKGIKYNSHLKSTEFYNPITNKFEKGPDLPEELSGFGIIKGDKGNIYILGGLINNNKTDNPIISKKIIKFNPKTNQFKFMADMFTPHFEASYLKLELNKILILYGVDYNWNKYKSIELFNISDNTASLLYKNPPVHENVNPIVLPDHTVLFAGGSEGIGIGHVSYKDVYTYNPRTNAFKQLKTKLKFYRENAKTIVLKDGNILILGGNRSYFIDFVKTPVTAEIYMFNNKIER